MVIFEKFNNIDNRLLSLLLVKHGMTEAVIFGPDGQKIDFLSNERFSYKKNAPPKKRAKIATSAREFPRPPVGTETDEKMPYINSKNRFEIAKKIDEIMTKEKKLFPNVDFYGGLLLSELGFEVDLFTPIFVAGRSVGWSAHCFEQREQDTLIRPAAKYIGIEERE